MSKRKSKKYIPIFIAVMILLVMFIAIGNAILLGRNTKPRTIMSESKDVVVDVIVKPTPSPEPETVKVLLAGDVMLGRTVTVESLSLIHI